MRDAEDQQMLQHAVTCPPRSAHFTRPGAVRCGATNAVLRSRCTAPHQQRSPVVKQGAAGRTRYAAMFVLVVCILTSDSKTEQQNTGQKDAF